MLDEEKPSSLVITLPVLLGVLAILVVVWVVYRHKRVTSLPHRRSGDQIDYNATPLGKYEPVNRWSESTFTSVAGPNSRNLPTTMAIPPPAKIERTPSSATWQNADVSCATPQALSWHVRQQQRTVLNNAALVTLAVISNAGRAAGPQTPVMSGHGSTPEEDHSPVRARSARMRSRANSWAEMELRDVQLAFAFQEQQERIITSCRSLETMQQQA